MSLAKDVNLTVMAERSDGLNGAQIKAVCTEAGMFALRDDKDKITMANFQAALEKIRSVKGDDWHDMLVPGKQENQNMFV
jgi:proteasome regulatory subunit